MRVLIIIVTFNGMRWLPRCLDSAVHQSVSADILVVDNQSTDGTQAYITDAFSNIHLIESKVNLGFGKANNLGIAYGLKNGYDYFFLLNQDAYLEPDTIETLIKVQQLNPDFGILSPVQYDGTGTDMDHKFKVLFKSSKNCKLHPAALLPPGKPVKLFTAKFVMAAFWLMSRACVERVGQFDEIFNHYGEDNDYLNRVWFHRFKVGIVGNCNGFHDRENRALSVEKQLNVSFASYLAALTNPNMQLATAYWKTFRVIERRFRKAVLRKDFSQSSLIFKKLTALYSRTPSIIKTRKRNKLVQSS
jgi:GT2 family glycosyltransferase